MLVIRASATAMSSAACSALSSAYSLSEKASPALATTPWPQYLHLFATERTVSIETTHAHGNASFLSLREQTWVATDNDPAALREEDHGSRKCVRNMLTRFREEIKI
jgi:hypothetical protein